MRDRLIIALLLILGPRVSEVARADVDDFVREPDQTRWRITGKGGNVRTVSLSEPLSRALEEYLVGLRPQLLARRPGDPEAARALLLTWRGRRIDAQAIRGLLNRCIARMPEEYRRAATPHALRHTTATLLVAQGGTSRSSPSCSDTPRSRRLASISTGSRASSRPRSGPIPCRPGCRLRWGASPRLKRT
ncbi:tyrosine-type recombinase/integrase [Oerskovia sp. M15]